MHTAYLIKFFKKHHKKYSHTLIDELIHMVTFDTLLLHNDKSATNIMIEINNKNNEAHLWSIDSSHLWSRFNYLENKFDEYVKFYKSLTLNQQKTLLNFIESIEIDDIISSLRKTFLDYSFAINEIEKSFNENKKALLNTINNATNLKVLKNKFYLSDYYKSSQ